MKKQVLISFISLFGTLLSSCVTPPEQVRARVLPEDEIALVSTLKRGQQLAKSGHFSEAEIFFRRAILADEVRDGTYNDLGYVLLGQGRLREAEIWLKRALEINPDNLEARENLARLYFRQGEYAASMREYKAMLSYDSVQSELSGKEQREIREQLAVLAWLSGDEEGAVCASAELARAGDISAKIRYLRLLLFLERGGEAARFADELKLEEGFEDSVDLLVDHGVAQLGVGNLAQAEEGFFRALLIARPGSSSLRYAAVLSVVTSQLLHDPEKLELSSGRLIEEFPEICNSTRDEERGILAPLFESELAKSLIGNSVSSDAEVTDRQLHQWSENFWPSSVRETVITEMKKWCSNVNGSKNGV